ncbi:cytochrome P450 4C1-like [Athalia rosae]|uniref:cytochrome P450 4C1-like n=1 Tax=Athalia rosae TaxID=37344 RepID=UPI00203422FD|nr:cytochrome P450 4C1-like [Athalia rosae]
MTIDSQDRIGEPLYIGDGNLSLFWTYSYSGFLMAVCGLLLGAIWLSKGVQDWRHRRLKFLKLAAKLPGPPALPLIGNALHVACSSNEVLHRIVNLCKSYDSPYRFWLGPKLYVVVTKPSDIEVILTSNKAAYKDDVYRYLVPFIGQGLISGSGPTNRTHRKVIMPMLNGKVIDSYVEYFDRQSRCCVEELEKLVDTDEFDIHPFIEHCTIDIILETIMGTPGTTQQYQGYKHLVEANRSMYKIIHARMLKLWLHPEWIFARTKYSEEQNSAMEVIQEFTENLLDRKRKEHHAVERGSVITDRPRLMLLEQLIAHVEQTNLMNDVQLRDEVYTLFTAAQDTTTVISSFACLMLGMHSKVQDKVRAELREVLDENTLTAEDLPKLTYLEMVIKETLRLFPIGPIIARKLMGEVDMETCTLPEGCSVAIFAYQTHRDPRYWSNPDKFDPDRFLAENSVGRHPYAYIPFSGGLRGCIGQKYAMMCVKTIMANIVRRYRLNCNGSLESLKLTTDISIRSIDGYKISITRV